MRDPSTEPLIRPATLHDLPSVVAMLMDDPLGQQREAASSDIDPGYANAFAAIEDDPHNRVWVAERDSRIIGCFQLTFIPNLTYKGSWRAQIEGVRISADHRGTGVGTLMIRYAIEQARDFGCSLVQLTSDKARLEAIGFYEALGFTASHEGMKLRLE